MKSKVILLIPTYNERRNIPVLMEALQRLEDTPDILFIDDSSPDGSGDLLDEIASQSDKVQVIHRPEKAGLGSAYLEGFAHSLKAGYEFSICMDADLSHNPEDLPQLLEALESHDLVGGSRYLPNGGILNWPLRRLFLSKAAAIYTRLLTRMPFTDPTGGFNAYRNRMLSTLSLQQVNSQGYAFQIEMKYLAWKQGFRVTEIPIIFTERRQGKSKMSTGIIHEALLIVWRLVLSR